MHKNLSSTFCPKWLIDHGNAWNWEWSGDEKWQIDEMYVIQDKGNPVLVKKVQLEKLQVVKC